jgi:hypothetical protein
VSPSAKAVLSPAEFVLALSHTELLDNMNKIMSG